MQNLALKIEDSMYNDAPSAASLEVKTVDTCAACGEKLFGAAIKDTSWQAWGAFWGISGMTHVELACGACGEYLQRIFTAENVPTPFADKMP